MCLADKLKEMKVRFDTSGELSSSDKSFIETYYERILFRPFNKRGCGQCYRDAFIEMYLYAMKNGIKEMGKFILKRQEVLHIIGDSNVYSRVNITDEIAIKFLRKYPQAITRFESYPDNWEELVAQKQPKTTKEAADNQQAEKPSIQNTQD